MSLNKVIIVPDSFKGALTAKAAAEIIASAVGEAFPECEIVKMPIADGGEGSVDAVLSAVGGSFFNATVQSPDEREIEAHFGITGNGVAVLEMAQSSGITRQNGLHPMTSNTYGFGQLILAALDCRTDGVCGKRKSAEPAIKEFMLCIGGSATTDGGCGMAAALGVRFTDKQGNDFVPCGETLCDIVGIDVSGLDERVSECSFTVMCDVDNLLFGESGAAFVYAPQKGANPEQVRILDNGLRHYGAVLEQHFGRSFSNIPGAGAAGGLGAGCMAFLGAKLRSGIDALLDLYNFKAQCKDADLIITGEGKLDSQSFQGKVLSGILREAGTVPVWSICGVCDCDEGFLQTKGVKVFQASEGVTKEDSMREPEKFLKIAAKRAMEAVETKLSKIKENHHD